MVSIKESETVKELRRIREEMGKQEYKILEKMFSKSKTA